jgi:hypothetical protein
MKSFSFFNSRILASGLLAAALLFTLALQPQTVLADTRGNATGRVVQVALETHKKISQYTQIDSSANGYGKNACGLVAAAAAIGGENWVEVVDLIAEKAGSDYHKNSGIQPSKYVNALSDAFGIENIEVLEKSTVEQLYQELAEGHIVIVDIKVNPNTNTPSAKAPNYAHFARVLGIDMDKQEIYIENTLRGAPYWTVSFDTFMKAWDTPETTSSMIPDPHNAEAVTNWAVVLNKELLNDLSNEL